MGADQTQFQNWKKLVPYIYDWFTNHNLTWPSLSCRWGPEVESSADRRKQTLYLSEQTDGSEPNKLLVVTADIARPRVAAAESVAAWVEQGKSAFISKPSKTLLHPGEVNKIREVPQRPSVVVTHTDSPKLFVWDLDSQPDRAADKGASSKESSKSDLVLEGHEDNAEFALGISTAAQQPMVASGGKDALVMVWNLADHITSLGTPGAGPSGGSGGAGGATLQAQLRLAGHENTVEDVTFLPGSAEQLASVGDDYAVLLWDTRSGTAPTLRIADAHGAHDVHCVDWSALRPDYFVTGAADGTVKVWDRRNTSTPTFAFQYHSEAVMRVEWSPHAEGVFASGGDDRLVCLWDLNAKAGEGGEGKKGAKSALPPQLMFQHAGHKASIVDLQWDPSDPWTLMSVSDDVREGGGGTLQLWRVSDLIYRPDEEVLAELEQYRDYIVSGNEAKLKPSTSQQPSRATSQQAPSSQQQPQQQQEAAAHGADSAPAAGAEAAADVGSEGEEPAAPMDTEEQDHHHHHQQQQQQQQGEAQQQ